MIGKQFTNQYSRDNKIMTSTKSTRRPRRPWILWCGTCTWLASGHGVDARFTDQRICWVSISGAGDWHENAPRKTGRVLEPCWHLSLLGCKAGLMSCDQWWCLTFIHFPPLKFLHVEDDLSSLHSVERCWKHNYIKILVFYHPKIRNMAEMGLNPARKQSIKNPAIPAIPRRPQGWKSSNRPVVRDTRARGPSTKSLENHHERSDTQWYSDILRSVERWHEHTWTKRTVTLYLG
jgi:hypothetical protein